MTYLKLSPAFISYSFISTVFGISVRLKIVHFLHTCISAYFITVIVLIQFFLKKFLHFL